MKEKIELFYIAGRGVQPLDVRVNDNDVEENRSKMNCLK